MNLASKGRSVILRVAGKPLALALTLAFTAFGVAEGMFLAANVARPEITVGLDYRLYLGLAQQWLTTGTFYLPHQVVGPYSITFGDAMYPPTLLYLLVPFLYLHPVLWWGIPLAIIGWNVRGAPWWAWPLLSALLVYPRTWAMLLYGTPTLWMLAAIACGWSALALVKPTLAPVALLGVRDRRWWVTVAALVILTLPLPWMDYIKAMAHARNEFGLLYPLGELPIALVLFVVCRAAAAERRQTDAAA